MRLVRAASLGPIGFSRSPAPWQRRVCSRDYSSAWRVQSSPGWLASGSLLPLLVSAIILCCKAPGPGRCADTEGSDGWPGSHDMMSAPSDRTPATHPCRTNKRGSVDTMRLGKMRSTSGGRGHRRASAWRVVGVVVVASLVALAASLSLLALPTSAFARTLSAEPAGGGFVENSDHTWTLYAYGHVIKVYSAAEKGNHRPGLARRGI